MSKEKRERRKLTEKIVVRAVMDVRADAPRIGAQKLLHMLMDIYPGLMLGRDRFYQLMHKHSQSSVLS